MQKTEISGTNPARNQFPRLAFNLREIIISLRFVKGCEGKVGAIERTVTPSFVEEDREGTA